MAGRRQGNDLSRKTMDFAAWLTGERKGVRKE
jgi:hypothetical protein